MYSLRLQGKNNVAKWHYFKLKTKKMQKAFQWWKTVRRVRFILGAMAEDAVLGKFHLWKYNTMMIRVYMGLKAK
jgi:hypothetical protein